MKETSFSVTNSCVKPVFVNDGTRLLRLDVEDVFYVGAEEISLTQAVTLPEEDTQIMQSR